MNLRAWRIVISPSGNVAAEGEQPGTVEISSAGWMSCARYGWYLDTRIPPEYSHSQPPSNEHDRLFKNIWRTIARCVTSRHIPHILAQFFKKRRVNAASSIVYENPTSACSINNAARHKRNKYMIYIYGKANERQNHERQGGTE